MVFGGVLSFFVIESLSIYFLNNRAKTSEALTILALFPCAWILIDDDLLKSLLGLVLFVLAAAIDLSKRAYMSRR